MQMGFFRLHGIEHVPEKTEQTYYAKEGGDGEYSRLYYLHST